MSMKPAVFWGQVSSVCQAATGAFLPPKRYCFQAFVTCLASQVRVNFLHLFLRHSTLRSRQEEFSLNKWHMINHAPFCLTACVKVRSGCATRKVFLSLKSCFFGVLFLFFYICVPLWAWRSCPFSSFHRGFWFGFLFYLCGAHQIHWQENE